jgi:GNAT superfamily N-acetyltransferase
VTKARVVPLPDLPPGLAARAASRRDVDAIFALVASCEAANDGVSEVHPTDIAQVFDLAQDDGVVLAVQDAAWIVAWATVADGRATVDVHPDHRGRGIGAALMAWTEGRARASGRTRVRQVVTDADIGARRLFETRGYTTVQTSWILDKPLDETPPAVEVPSGISLRPFAATDVEAVFRVIEDAFNEWPDREPASFEWWATHVRDHPAFAPALSRVAFDGDQLVGAAVCLDYDGEDEGWVEQLATKATHRHRGIARALLGSAFLAFHGTGRRMVGLSTNSRTGALGLYERLGMRVRRSYTGWARDLD